MWGHHDLMITGRGRMFPSGIGTGSVILQVLPLWYDHPFLKKSKPRNTSVPPKGCFFSVFVNCCRPWLVTRPWPSAWWMQRCTQTWACWCRWHPSSTAAYSFIKWFVSLLMHSEERAIWTSWVSELREKLSHFLIYRTRGREIKWSDIILYPRYLSRGWNWEHKCFYRLITKGNMRCFLSVRCMIRQENKIKMVSNCKRNNFYSSD